MYFPIMKNRDEELRVVKGMSNYFGELIIPVLEIIRDEYFVRYRTDEVTGEFIFEKNQD